MANPYSKYTGQRVSAIPAGYLEANARAAASLQSGLASIGEAIGKYYGNKRKDEEEEKQAELDREALRFIMESDSALMDDPPEEVDERNLFSTTDIYVPQNAADPFKREEGKLVWPGEAKEHGTSEHTPEPSVMLPSARKAVVGRKTRERTPEELRDAKIELQNNNMAAFLERYLGKEGPRVSDNIVKLAMDRYDKGKQAAESEYDKAVEAGLRERSVAVSEKTVGISEENLALAKEKDKRAAEAAVTEQERLDALGRVDKSNRDAIIASLRAKGVKENVLSALSKAGSSEGMLDIWGSLPEESKASIPVSIQELNLLRTDPEFQAKLKTDGLTFGDVIAHKFNALPSKPTTQVEYEWYKKAKENMSPADLDQLHEHLGLKTEGDKVRHNLEVKKLQQQIAAGDKAAQDYNKIGTAQRIDGMPGFKFVWTSSGSGQIEPDNPEQGIKDSDRLRANQILADTIKTQSAIIGIITIDATGTNPVKARQSIVNMSDEQASLGNQLNQRIIALKKFIGEPIGDKELIDYEATKESDEGVKFMKPTGGTSSKSPINGQADVDNINAKADSNLDNIRKRGNN